MRGARGDGNASDGLYITRRQYGRRCGPSAAPLLDFNAASLQK